MRIKIYESILRHLCHQILVKDDSIGLVLRDKLFRFAMVRHGLRHWQFFCGCIFLPLSAAFLRYLKLKLALVGDRKNCLSQKGQKRGHFPPPNTPLCNLFNSADLVSDALRPPLHQLRLSSYVLSRQDDLVVYKSCTT